MNRIDNFNRADDTLAIGTPSDGGSAWVAEMSGGDTWGIYQNTAYHVGTIFPSIATLESSMSDVDVEVTISADYYNFGIAFRVVDELNFLALYINSAQQTLFKSVNGVTTGIGTYSGSMATGDTFRVRANGSTLESYQNDVLRVSTTETFNQTATKHGLYNGDNPASAGTQYDAFSITGLGGGLSIPVAMFHYRQQGIS
jgi:hypothetical protein